MEKRFQKERPSVFYAMEKLFKKCQKENFQILVKKYFHMI